MTIGGWTCMIFAIGVVTILFSWCCFKVATSSSANCGVLDAAESVRKQSH